MIRNIFISVFIYLFFAMNLAAQDSLNYQSKWQSRPLFGVNIPITKLLNGNRSTDNLFQYSDNAIYWQVMSATYFFHKHWGIEMNVQGMTGGGIRKKPYAFVNDLKSEYENNYYVNTFTGPYDLIFNPIGGHFERGLVGLIYRYEKDRYFFYPKISIGVTSLHKNGSYVILKQRNSNNILQVAHNVDNKVDHLLFATSAAFGYKLKKRLYLNVDLMTSYFKTNTIITKTTTDLNTLASSNEYFKYNKNIFTLSIGGGLIVVLK